jgi:hypothetical protein
MAAGRWIVGPRLATFPVVAQWPDHKLLVLHPRPSPHTPSNIKLLHEREIMAGGSGGNYRPAPGSLLRLEGLVRPILSKGPLSVIWAFLLRSIRSRGVAGGDLSSIVSAENDRSINRRISSRLGTLCLLTGSFPNCHLHLIFKRQTKSLVALEEIKPSKTAWTLQRSRRSVKGQCPAGTSR